MLHVVIATVMLSACDPRHRIATRVPGLAGTPEGSVPSQAAPDPAPRVEAAKSTAVLGLPDPIDPREKEPIRNATGALAGINDQLLDIFYDYDRADLTEAASLALQHDARLLAAALTEFPGVKIVVEGHCDERGSAEYNLALGDSRAAHTADALRNLGLGPAKLETVSYGKENPQCEDANESCWQKNRRAHLALRAAN
jgi:peptidoglycan-associated lipoprotein